MGRTIEQGSRVVAPSGGSGFVSIEDELFAETSELIDITGVADDGGHSLDVRTIMGTLPPGDASHKIAIHIRDEETRELFTYRWKLEGRKGVRTGSEFLALAEHLSKSHSAGIKRIEKAFRCDYMGRVVPISDDDIYIRLLMKRGKPRFGESSVDNLKFGESGIKDIVFVNKQDEEITPQVNPEAVEFAANSDFFILPPSSFWGSHMQIAKVPGFAEAVHISRGPIIWICNAVNTPETDGYTTSNFAEKFAQVYGREIDIALVDDPKYKLPRNYWHPESTDIEEAGKRIFVQNDLKDNSQFVKKVVHTPLSRVEYIGDKDSGYKYVIRHDGKLTVNALQKALSEYSA